jgi:hypothetical protein
VDEKVRGEAVGIGTKQPKKEQESGHNDGTVAHKSIFAKGRQFARAWVLNQVEAGTPTPPELKIEIELTKIRHILSLSRILPYGHRLLPYPAGFPSRRSGMADRAHCFMHNRIYCAHQKLSRIGEQQPTNQALDDKNRRHNVHLRIIL